MRNPIECSNEPMRDRLPEYVLGTLTSAEYSAVSAHLTGCESCASEVQIIRSAGAAYPVPTIDIGAIVAALPTTPVAPARVTPVLTMSSGALRLRHWRLAAAISFLVLGGISFAALRGVMRQSASTDVPIAAVDTSMPALASVAPAIVDSTGVAVAESVRENREVRVSASGLSIGAAADLSDAQLQPSTEPAPSHHPMTAPDSPEDMF
jgi:anti-sigma factor RsiW